MSVNRAFGRNVVQRRQDSVVPASRPVVLSECDCGGRGVIWSSFCDKDGVVVDVRLLCLHCHWSLLRAPKIWLESAVREIELDRFMEL